MKNASNVVWLVLAILLGVAGIAAPLLLRDGLMSRVQQSGHTPALGQSALDAPDALKPCAETLGQLWRVIRGGPLPEGETLKAIQNTQLFDRARDRCVSVTFVRDQAQETWVMHAVPGIEEGEAKGCRFYAYAGHKVELSCPKTLFYPGKVRDKKLWKPGQ